MIINSIFKIRDCMILYILYQLFINNELTINNFILLGSIFLIQCFPLFEFLKSERILRFDKYYIIFQSVYKDRVFVVISVLKEIVIGILTIMLVYVFNNPDYRIVIMFMMALNFSSLVINSKLFVGISTCIKYISTLFDVTKPISPEDISNLNIEDEYKELILNKIEKHY